MLLITLFYSEGMIYHFSFKKLKLKKFKKVLKNILTCFKKYYFLNLDFSFIKNEFNKSYLYLLL